MINCFVSKRILVNSSIWVSLYGKDNDHETMLKENDGDEWSSDNVMLSLGRRQNRDAVEW
jgi:hypothetical protein